MTPLPLDEAMPGETCAVASGPSDACGDDAVQARVWPDGYRSPRCQRHQIRPVR